MRRLLPWLIAIGVVTAIAIGLLILGEDRPTGPVPEDALTSVGDEGTVDPLSSKKAVARLSGEGAKRREETPGASRSEDALDSNAGEGPGRIAGAVMSTASEPIPEATILVREDGRRIAQATSDAQGRFVLEGLPVRPEELTLRAGAGGFIPLIFDFAIPRAHPEFQDVVLTLPKARVLGGVVVGESGAPIEGASVWLDWNERDVRPAQVDAVTLTSDAEGRFEFHTAPEGELEVWAWKPGIALIGSGAITSSDSEVRLRATEEAPGRIAVEAVAEDGKTPVAGAVVEIRPSGKRHLQRMFSSRLTTDRQGKAASEELPVLEYSCQVTAGERTFVRTGGAEGDRTALTPGETLQSRFRARHGYSIRGRVELASGPPVEGVVLVASVAGNESEGTTQAGGAFELELQPDGRGRRRASFRLIGGDFDLLPDDQSANELTEGPLLLRASRRANLKGVVLDGNGPVADATVRARPTSSEALFRDDWRGLAEVSPARTNGEGRFSLLAPTIAGIELVAEHPGRGSATMRLNPRSGESLGDLILRLDRSIAVFGRVLDSEGAPVGGAAVRAKQESVVPKGEATNLQGEYRIEGLRPGALELEARYRDVWYSTGGDLFLDQSGERGPVDIVVHEPWILEGSVATSEGEPVPRAEVDVRSVSDERVAKERTQADGTFRIALPADRPVVLKVRWPNAHGAVGGVPSSVERQVAPGAEPQHIVFESPHFGGVRGRLVLAGRVSHVSTTWTREGEIVSHGIVALDEEGRFQLERIRPGVYDLEIRAQGHRAFQVPVAIEADRMTDLGELSPEPGVPTTVVATDPSGQPLPDVLVGSRGSGSARTNTAGRVELRLDPVERALLTLSKEGYAQRWRLLGAPDVGKEHTVVLPRAGTIRLRLGEGLDSWRIQVRWLGKEELRPRNLGFGGVDGRDRIYDSLAPGRYRIRAWDPELGRELPDPLVPGRSEERVVTVPEGEEVLVELGGR